MNAPAIFQLMMLEVIEGQEDHSSAYIDDVLIYSKTWEEHLCHIRLVLESLRANGLTAKPSKCVWAVNKMEYLGFVVGDGQVSVPEARVAALMSFKQPVTKRDMRAFLGTVGYYRRFIPHFADKAYCLTKATAKTTPRRIQWTSEMLANFKCLCDCVCDVCVLHVPLQSDSFVLQTDASMCGMSGVLNVIRDGAELPVGFYSRQFQDAETCYSATELTCLAVVEAVRHFEVHLHG